MKETAVVICPGRGTYGREELGYLKRHHADKVEFITGVDAFRTAHRRASVAELDAADAYKTGVHATSENASALIYACALADFRDIDRERLDVVAVTGNSLGWYLALAAGGALDDAGGVRVVDTTGALMQAHGGGGQLVYPLVDDDWRADASRTAIVEAAVDAANAGGGQVFVSIRLGGMVVLAGDDAGLAALEAALPEDGRFPMRLARHAAFHTPLLEHVSNAALKAIGEDVFRPPNLPLIDGRGVIWQPYAADVGELHRYTLRTQITQTYDFSKAVEVAVKEFAPDRLIVLGPGTTMGAPIAQELIKHAWRGMASKADFAALQKSDPFLLAMGVEGQRRLAAKPVSQPA